MKTIIDIEYLQQKPTKIDIIIAKIMRWKYNYNKEEQCWELKRRIKGYFIGKVFHPYPGQSVMYPIVFDCNDKTEITW